MKIQIIVFISIQFLFLNTISNAQVITSEVDKRFEASVLGGWLFAGSGSGAKVINAPIYSISAAYVKSENTLYELNVNTCYSKLKYDAYQGHSDTVVGYSQTYVMLGIVRVFRTEIPNFTPYISTSIGISNTSIQVPSSSGYTPTQLAAGLLGGIKVNLNKRIGLKFQARIQSPLSGLGLYLGVGSGGPSVGIGSYSGSVQFDVSTGLFFRL